MSDEAQLLIDIDGFEGPLDLLLELAKRQKVDLQALSMSALASQYLTFIEHAQHIRLELAADYLVMAAWLAYLKSRLLLPEPDNQAQDGHELAQVLAVRLQKLHAIRLAAQHLNERPRLYRDKFPRGEQRPVKADHRHVVWQANLYDLLSAYAHQRQISVKGPVHVMKRDVWSLEQARHVLRLLINHAHDWTMLDHFLIRYCVSPHLRATVTASSFSAMLEMAKQGQIDIRQEEAFAPLWVKAAKCENVSGAIV